MTVGVAVGMAGGLALLAFMRRVPLPSEGLYSPRVLAGVLVIFGVATVAQGSGFLAVLVAGIIIGDEPAPYKREIARFHSSLASLAEIVAFVMLGLTMRLSELASESAWADGLALAALLTFVIRPVLGGLVSLPVRLTVRERVFFLWTGLKGAVPILLGMAILNSGTPGAALAYQVIFVIVGFSVTVQGGLVPALAHRLAHPAADRRAGALVARRPLQRGTRGPAPLPRGRRRRRRRQRRRRPPLRRERLGQPRHQGRHPAHRRPPTPPCRPATTCWSWPTPMKRRTWSASSQPQHNPALRASCCYPVIADSAEVLTVHHRPNLQR